MRLLQVKYLDHPTIARFDGDWLLVESQIFGQDEDRLCHIVSDDTFATRVVVKGLGRIIQDTGRTIGLWQHLGGEGIFRPDLIGFSTLVPIRFHSRIKSRDQAVISYSGSTWRQIVEMLKGLKRLNPSFLEINNTLTIAQNEL
jgi:hypothetical protein